MKNKIIKLIFVFLLLATALYSAENPCQNKQVCFNNIHGVTDKLSELDSLSVAELSYKDLQERSQDIPVSIEALYEEARMFKELAQLRAQYEGLSQEELIKRVSKIKKREATRQAQQPPTIRPNEPLVRSLTTQIDIKSSQPILLNDHKLMSLTKYYVEYKNGKWYWCNKKFIFNECDENTQKPVAENSPTEEEVGSDYFKMISQLKDQNFDNGLQLILGTMADLTVNSNSNINIKVNKKSVTVAVSDEILRFSIEDEGNYDIEGVESINKVYSGKVSEVNSELFIKFREIAKKEEVARQPSEIVNMPENFKVAFIGDTGKGPFFRKVLELIKDEDADMVLHQGDLAYGEKNPQIPQLWFNIVDEVLGEDFPYFFSIGNHDIEYWETDNGYRAILQERFNRLNLEYTGTAEELGSKTSFEYNGLFVTLTAPGFRGTSFTGSDHDEFLDEELGKTSSPWKICSWHKNMRAMQPGEKEDETGWEVYETCREHGAIIVTGHSHSYSRTHVLSDMANQIVADSVDPLTISSGQTFAVVSGLGGKSIRIQDNDGEYFAKTYTKTQNANYGALFIIFNLDGDITRARGYFKNIDDKTIDEFELEYEQQLPAVASTAQNQIWPVADPVITSCYGQRSSTDFHDGIDFRAPVGTYVSIIDDGIVKKVCNAPCGGFGNSVIVQHNSGIFTAYNHLSQISVEEGEQLDKGSSIGKSGSTGASPAPHLDFKVYTSEQDIHGRDTAVDPFPYLPQGPYIFASTADSCQQLISQLRASETQVDIESQPEISEEGSEESSLASVREDWNEAIASVDISGKTWVSRFSSNGPDDDFQRANKGRYTIIFAPETTDFNQPVELIYFFHGLHGFTMRREPYDMRDRVAKQAKAMSEEGRNIIIVFPELPWSHGTSSGDRWKADSGRTELMWNGEDSDLAQLHDDVFVKIYGEYRSLQIGKVTLVGHSRGGAALVYAAKHPETGKNSFAELKNALGLSLTNTRIIFSDAGYTWGSENPYSVVYENYPDAELNIIVQDPSRSSAHSPTVNAIEFVKEIGGQSVQEWSVEYETRGDGTRYVSSYNTPGAQSNQPFQVPGHPRIYYIPLTKGHDAIAQVSLAWPTRVS